MTRAVPGGGVRFEEDLDGGIGEVEFGDKVLEKSERGKGIVEGIVPISVGRVVGEVVRALSYFFQNAKLSDFCKRTLIE